jgi:hypothetical protein
MDCINEAKKFVKRAQEASTPEVIHQHLAMADWYLAEALKERSEDAQSEKAQEPKGSRAARA